MLVKANPLLLCQLTLLVAALASFLYDRSRVLYTFYANTPDRLPSVNTFQSHEVKFPNIRNCEDVLLLEDKGLALLACDDGREMWNVVQVRTRLFFKKKKKKKRERSVANGSRASMLKARYRVLAYTRTTTPTGKDLTPLALTRSKKSR
jgi:hypothetical protein